MSLSKPSILSLTSNEGTFSVLLVQLEKYISSDLNDIKRMSLKRNSDAEDARRPPVRKMLLLHKDGPIR